MTTHGKRQLNSLASVIQASIDTRLVDLHTALPGIVVSYDAATQEADVRVPLRRLMRDLDDVETPLDIPVLPRVPVLFARAGGFAITFPLAAGDEVLLIFGERDASEWLADGGDHVPGSARMHDYPDAVAIPGYTSEPNRLTGVNSSDLELRSDDGQTTITIGADQTVRINGTGGLAFGDGTEEIVALISETLDLMRDIEIDHDFPRPVTTAYKAIIDAVRVRVDAMKAP